MSGTSLAFSCRGPRIIDSRDIVVGNGEGKSIVSTAFSTTFTGKSGIFPQTTNANANDDQQVQDEKVVLHSCRSLLS